MLIHMPQVGKDSPYKMLRGCIIPTLVYNGNVEEHAQLGDKFLAYGLIILALQAFSPPKLSIDKR